MTAPAIAAMAEDDAAWGAGQNGEKDWIQKSTKPVMIICDHFSIQTQS